jgi:cobalt-zinc-cadmium efflux system outer membrane protein
LRRRIRRCGPALILALLLTQGLAAEPPEEPAGELSLRQALALTLERNPELVAFSHEIRANEAAVLQAGVLPNPVLELGAENLANTRLREEGDRTLSLGFGQLIELGGKRAARIRLAESGREVANREYEAKRLEVLSTTSQRFVDVLAAQQGVGLAAESLELAAQVANAVGRRVQAGKVSPVEETKAQLALAAARVESEQGKRQLAAARQRLSAMWAVTAPQFSQAAGELEQIPVLPPYEQLADRMRANPELARWGAEAARRRAGIDAERAKAVGDITVSAGVRRFSQFDDHALVLGLSIPLPVFDQNRGGILEANRRLDKALNEQRAAESRLTVALGEVYQRLGAVASEIEALRTSILPGARSAYDAATKGYQLGRFGILDVLDAQRTLFQARAQYVRALSEYHRGAAELERLAGPDLITSRNSR